MRCVFLFALLLACGSLAARVSVDQNVQFENEGCKQSTCRVEVHSSEHGDGTAIISRFDGHLHGRAFFVGSVWTLARGEWSDLDVVAYKGDQGRGTRSVSSRSAVGECFEDPRTALESRDLVLRLGVHVDDQTWIAAAKRNGWAVTDVNLQAWISMTIAEVDFVYTRAFGVAVELNSITVLQDKPCPNSIDTALDTYTARFAADAGEDTAVIVKITHCFTPPGEVGLANNDYVCRPDTVFCNGANCRRGPCPNGVACFGRSVVVHDLGALLANGVGHELGHANGCAHSSEKNEMMSAFLGTHTLQDEGVGNSCVRALCSTLLERDAVYPNCLSTSSNK